MALKVKGGFRFGYTVAKNLPITEVALLQDSQSNISTTPFADLKELEAEQIIDYIKSSAMPAEQGGLMGEKLDCQSGMCQLLILNALESEPGVSCVHAMLRNHPEKIVLGLKIIMRALGVSKTVVAMTETMHVEADLLRNSLKQKNLLEIVALEEKYPVENDKVVYAALTGFISAPSRRNAVIVSVQDCYCIYELFVTGTLPKNHVVTVNGNNYRIPLGTPIAELPTLCQMEIPENCVPYIGGMVSATMAEGGAVVTHNTRAVQYRVPHTETLQRNCIHCGMCSNHCAIGLLPTYIIMAKEKGNVKKLSRLHPDACIGCGVCSAVCPVQISVREKIRGDIKQTVAEEQVNDNEVEH